MFFTNLFGLIQNGVLSFKTHLCPFLCCGAALVPPAFCWRSPSVIFIQSGSHRSPIPDHTMLLHLWKTKLTLRHFLYWYRDQKETQYPSKTLTLLISPYSVYNIGVVIGRELLNIGKLYFFSPIILRQWKFTLATIMKSSFLYILPIICWNSGFALSTITYFSLLIIEHEKIIHKTKCHYSICFSLVKVHRQFKLWRKDRILV